MDIKKDSELLQKQCGAMQNKYNEIIKADPDIEDYSFGIQMKKFLDQAKKDTDKSVNENANV